MKNTEKGGTTMPYIAIDKDIEKSWFRNDPYFFSIALYLIFNANYANNCSVKRGEIVTSHRSLSKKLNISRVKINSFFKEAKKRGMISHRRFGNGTIFTILNYGTWTARQAKLACHTGQSGLPDVPIHINNNKKNSGKDSRQMELMKKPAKSKSKKQSKKSQETAKKQPTEMWQLKEFWENKYNWHRKSTWPVFTFINRDWGMLKTLVKRYDHKDTKRYMEEYLNNDDTQLARKGYPLGILVCEAERMRQRDADKERKEIEHWRVYLNKNRHSMGRRIEDFKEIEERIAKYDALQDSRSAHC